MVLIINSKNINNYNKIQQNNYICKVFHMKNIFDQIKDKAKDFERIN